MNSKYKDEGNPRLFCFSDTPSCPCRELDLEEEISICNFVEQFAKTLIQKNDHATKVFLSKVCPEKKNEVLKHDSRATQLQKKAKKFLNQVKIGDLVYSIRQNEDVVFLEYPTHKFGDCKFRTADGTIKKDAPFLFSIVSRGDKFGEFKTKDSEESYLYMLEGRKSGFRVERYEKGDYYILRIFGDTQEEVDSFIAILRNDFILDDY